ncbi:tRNA lysidine(34) synthetase TilS [Hyphomonas sp.]|uniref:tRNA lysidine(34) synthetase TilS n=1 Tax=Hyphomonas sp. TaxID=87 RepID=UPI000C613940|nr:tRNA lysidine(34) synthetase TilS [Hyphomonas sp.]MAU67408.1 tRNA lysidine(34) synthetase TilS [Hyphomonas sp.]MBM58048.1 tRNA lysidine(34) synthetase TilS [Hyphomonas sp.]
MRQLKPPAAPADLNESLDRLCSLAAGPVCVAVSGGSDSLALLKIAAGWAGASGRSLLALTVDHGLRPEAADEARFVADVAARLGAPHRTLRWPAPVPGQAKARQARHELLAAAAREAGSVIILTAHTQDDQAETFLIRARAGSGWYGLAGIQPLSLSPAGGTGVPVLVARPLLSASRAGLREMLRAEGQDWVEDPSNSDPAYERVRMRQLLAAEPALRARVLALQEKLQLLRQVQDRSLGRWLSADVEIRADGTLRTPLPIPPGEMGERALGALIALAGGRTRPLRTDALSRLTRRVANPDTLRPATLGGAAIRIKNGNLKVAAEHALPAEQVNAIPARLSAMVTACSAAYEIKCPRRS